MPVLGLLEVVQRAAQQDGVDGAVRKVKVPGVGHAGVDRGVGANRARAARRAAA
jgi:hypothetical protein